MLSKFESTQSRGRGSGLSVSPGLQHSTVNPSVNGSKSGAEPVRPAFGSELLPVVAVETGPSQSDSPTGAALRLRPSRADAESPDGRQPGPTPGMARALARLRLGRPGLPRALSFKLRSPPERDSGTLDRFLSSSLQP